MKRAKQLALPGIQADSNFGRSTGGAHDGASFTAREMAAWQPRRGSADADLLPDLASLYSRSRDIDRNNGVAKGGIQTIIDNVVGTGLRVSPQPDWRRLGRDIRWAMEWSRDVRAKFCEYWWSTKCHAADSMTGDQITAQIFRAQLLNGGAFALPLWLPDRGDGYATKFQTVEIDRLSNPNGAGDTARLRNGFEFDEYGAPIAANVRASHPGDLWWMDIPPGMYTWQRIPRRTPEGRLRWIHIFDPERSGQTMGKPLLSSVLVNFKNLDRYTLYELQAAMFNAMIAGVITTPLDQDGILELFSKDKKEYMRARAETAVRMEGGQMIPLFPGDELQPFLPSRPATAFAAFTENIFRIIGVGLDLPYELLMKDFSKTNYSSARAALLEAWRSFNRRRDWLGTQWLDPVYSLWLEEQVNAGTIDAPGFYDTRYAYERCKWIGPGRGWIDVQKEAEAAGTRIKNKLSTLEQECAEQGLDWLDVLEQQALEREEMQRLGIDPTFGSTPAAALPAPGDSTNQNTPDAPTDNTNANDNANANNRPQQPAQGAYA